MFIDHAIPQDACIGHLELDHLMARSLDKLDQSKALIRASYQGRLSVAEDLACYTPD